MRQFLTFLFVLTISTAAMRSGEAKAACTIPNNLTNVTTADATQVMANFNAVAGCTGNASTLTTGDLPAAQMTTNLSSAIDGAIGSTRGSILYRGASGWTALMPGTSGYVLSTNGSGADPTWVAQTGGGGSLPAFYVNPQAVTNNGNGGPATIWQAIWLEVGDTVSGGAIVVNGTSTLTLGAALYGPGPAGSFSGLPRVASGALTSTSVTAGHMYKLAFSSTFTVTTAGLYWVGVYQSASLNMYTSGFNPGSYTTGAISSWAATAPALSGGFAGSATAWGYR